MARHTEEGRAWFAVLGGVPAIIGWIAYGLAWLLGPQLAVQPDPLLWAAYGVGGYYLLLVSVTVCPLILMGLSS